MTGRWRKLPADRRALLIEAIVAEVGERGFQGASVAGIAERAGTSKASLFYHFTDRDEMLAVAVGSLLEELLGAGEGGELALPEAATPEQFWSGFEAAYRGMAQGLAASPARARFARAWLEQMGRSDLPKALAPLMDRLRAAADHLVSTGIELGALRSDLPRPLLVRALFALAIAADGWMAGEVQGGAPVDEAVRPVLALVRSAFGAPGDEASRRR